MHDAVAMTHGVGCAALIQISSVRGLVSSLLKLPKLFWESRFVDFPAVSCAPFTVYPSAWFGYSRGVIGAVCQFMSVARGPGEVLVATGSLIGRAKRDSPVHYAMASASLGGSTKERYMRRL
jgi:hypothetical protein